MGPSATGLDGRLITGAIGLASDAQVAEVLDGLPLGRTDEQLAAELKTNPGSLTIVAWAMLLGELVDTTGKQEKTPSVDGATVSWNADLNAESADVDLTTTSEERPATPVRLHGWRRCSLAWRLAHGPSLQVVSLEPRARRRGVRQTAEGPGRRRADMGFETATPLHRHTAGLVDPRPWTAAACGSGHDVTSGVPTSTDGTRLPADRWCGRWRPAEGWCSRLRRQRRPR